MRPPIHCAFLLGLTLWHAAAGSAGGGQSPSREIPTVLQAHAHELSVLTDDAQALELFMLQVGPALGLKDAVSVLTTRTSKAEKPSPFSSPVNQEVRKQAMELVKELAAWRWALGLLKAAETGYEAVGRLLPEAKAQLLWLTPDSQRSLLRETWRLASAITAIPGAEPGNLAGSSGYQDYAAALEQAHPRMTGPELSWLAIAERDGAEGVLARLAKVGERWPESERHAFASRFFAERLRPVLMAHLIARAIRAEAEAERRAADLWLRLSMIADVLREQRGLARLCGTWQWTVHNHQSHGEHKMIMSFPPPGTDPGPGIRPARIMVSGDTVYLRWELDRGIVQEDSLLFSGAGQRLEGTFANSAGPWGSIAAKRISACEPAGTGDQGTLGGRGKSPSPLTK